MRSTVLLLCIFWSFTLCAQQKPVQLGKTASDCNGALLLNDTVVGPVFSPKGFGEKLEISGYELGDPYFIEREHNTVWYKFVVPYDATFTFDLVPVRKDDDFDFMLFHYDGPNFCSQVAQGDKIPIRTNISRKNLEVNGQTGLSEGSIEPYVPSGPGSSYSRELDVRKGTTYYLLVDNPFRENEGHTIYLHFKALTAERKARLPLDEPSYDLPYRKLQIQVTDQQTNERIAANIFVEGLPDSVSGKFPSVSRVDLDVVSYRTYQISVLKKGYLLQSQTFIPKNDSLYTVDLKLKPLTKGDRINLENIKFDSDNTRILESSLPAVDQLKQFMELNPTMKVEIQGHVNGESKRNKKKYRKLSQARAKAIFDKLVTGGISESRISVVGFGNARMIYPTPLNNRQAEANRRVEVEITAL